VAWTPFVVSEDCWGTYAWDLAQSMLDLGIGGASYVPDDVDGSRLFSFGEDERPVLRDVWSGGPRDGRTSAGCDHRLAREDAHKGLGYGGQPTRR